MASTAGGKGQKKEGRVMKALREFVYGATMYEIVSQKLRARMHMEHLFMLITMGDMLGIPILPPYYTLRLLPYAIPHLKTWERQLLRERDISDEFAESPI